MRYLALVLALGMPAPVLGQEIIPDPPAGTYKTDLTHSRLIFRVNHLGFSNYTAFFTDFEGVLAFDPAKPEEMKLTARVNPASVETMFADKTLDFNGVIRGADLLNVAEFPEITFTSTKVVMTGEKTADVTGDLAFHGVTKPMTLQVTYNGGYGGMSLDPGGARIGFSATGSLMRSEFGMGYGVPAAGSTMGVGDKVEIIIETEMLNPDAPKAGQ